MSSYKILKYTKRIIELEKENQDLKKLAEEREKEIQELKEKIENLLRPKKDSSNSSIPSSQNRYHKPYPEREKSKHKSGGQIGHKGSNKKLVENPDITIELKPEKCSHCGKQHLIKTEKVEKRQLIKIPPMKAFITEYQKSDYQCSDCKEMSTVEFPKNIQSTVQYDESVESLIGYLKVQNNLSHKKIKMTMEDICGIEMSEGTVDNALTELAKEHQTNYDNIVKEIRKAKVVCSDETGIRINGENKYNWFFGNSEWSLFKTNGSRAYTAIEELFKEEFPLYWVSDRYKGQLKAGAKFHQVCLAHIIRNLKYIIKVDKSKWATNLLRSIQGMIHERKELGFNRIDREGWINKIKNFFTKRELKGKETKTIFNSLSKVVDEMVLFLKNPIVPWTNNIAERALRSIVVHLKMNGGFRSKEGAKRYDILNSIIESAKKQRLDILKVLSGEICFNFS